MHAQAKARRAGAGRWRCGYGCSGRKAAGERPPAVLFIDEIDNIGTRQGAGSRNYDDYWASLINRMLELLDGTSKSEGIIVAGENNLPEKIDPALLRSGRLETHVRIPMPDAETLIGILGHHLGTDLDADARVHRPYHGRPGHSCPARWHSWTIIMPCA